MRSQQYPWDVMLSDTWLHPIGMVVENIMSPYPQTLMSRMHSIYFVNKKGKDSRPPLTWRQACQHWLSAYKVTTLELKCTWVPVQHTMTLTTASLKTLFYKAEIHQFCQWVILIGVDGIPYHSVISHSVTSHDFALWHIYNFRNFLPASWQPWTTVLLWLAEGPSIPEQQDFQDGNQ